MKNRNFLYIIITVLIALNVFTLAFFFLKGPQNGPKDRPNPKTVVIEKLKFDTTQIEAYEVIIFEHSDRIESLDRDIKNAKETLYFNLSKSQNTVSNDSLYDAIAKAQAEIEMVHYNHFLDIKNICKPEQLKDFETLSNELSKIFGAPKRPKR